MSDSILHECGIALIRLRKPLSYYLGKYGYSYPINKMYVLMEKQYNRGQDGAGLATIKIDQEPGYRFFSRYRSMKRQAIEDIFKRIAKKYSKAKKVGKDLINDEAWLKKNVAFSGELWLGHLRYCTHGNSSIENVHPFLRQNNWRSRNLVMAGNFNMTNVDELFQILVDLGQHPKEKVDTVTVMEKIGHFLDEEVQMLFDRHDEHFTNKEVSIIIENELDMGRVLRRACKDFDGGYAMAGLTGSGSAFVVRDPSGIRPAYYYADDEVIVIASEKPAIKAAFKISYEEIKEITPGHALIINKNGDYDLQQILPARERMSCSFERIYFSRGTDPEIYHERKQLGRLLVPQVLQAINFDLKNTVFSYIPNTAETAFLGLMAGIDDYLIKKQREVILEGKPIVGSLEDQISFRPRVEKLVVKDARMRTFITDDARRNDLVSNVYDTTYEVVRKNRDTLVVLDDSIVRGTTLENSILRMLGQLEPRKIVIVSSAPQIRYPDCYGIDMSRMGDFIAFRAMLALLREQDKEYMLDEVFYNCLHNNKGDVPNYLKVLYQPFTADEISAKISQIVRPENFIPEIEIVFQTIESLHKAIPKHPGDWYFTGNYPTPGGSRVANKSFANFMQGKKVRAY